MAKIDKLVNEGKKHLEPGEEILYSVSGAYETKIKGKETVRKGVFLATNNRIVLFAKRTFGFDLEIFPYSNISSLELGKDSMGHKISFFASGNKVSMKWIHTGDINGFLDHVKKNIGIKRDAQPSAQASSADELKKFADLRDAGVISDDEFEAKKKQLLEI